METLKIILKWLSGKKGVIASIIGLVLAFCASKGLLDTETVVFLGSLSTLIFGSVSVATKSVVYAK